MPEKTKAALLIFANINIFLFLVSILSGAYVIAIGNILFSTIALALCETK